MVVPYDATAEADVLAGVAVGALPVDVVASEDYYVPSHARLAAALAWLAAAARGPCREVVVRGAGRRVDLDEALGHDDVTVALEVGGLAEALVATGSPRVADDVRVMARVLAEALPGGPRAAERVEELAEARRTMSALADAYERLAAGERVDAALVGVAS
ncbi:MAG: hypothetical protein M5U14_07070 [Acidimicrobiia bacterium]|nr:hypothetical protein [Acidimicrobiia bacterium]